MLVNAKSAARLSGALYLVIILLGVWSEAFVRARLIVAGDPAMTAQNILGAQTLFRLSLTADSVMALADAMLAVLLYFLLRPVSHVLALMALVFRLLQTAVIGMNLLNQQAVLVLLTGAVTPDAATAAFFADLHGKGYDLGLLFFGVNSLLTGYLVMRSGYFPKGLGVLLIAAGLVYLTGSYLTVLLPALSEGFAPAYLVPLLAETAFCLWLLIRAVDNARFQQAQSGRHP